MCPNRSSIQPGLATLLLLLCLLLALGGCADGGESLPEEAAGQTGLAPASGQPASAAGGSQPESPPDETPLVVWAPPFLSINANSRADAILAAALAELDPSATGPSVSLIPKAEQGSAALMAYLLAAQKAAPSILPDVVLLHSSELAQAAESGAISPLSAQEIALFPGLTGDIWATARVGEQPYGIPFMLDVEILVYNRASVTAPPATFEEVLSLGQPLLFVGGAAEELNPSLALALYLASGGQVDEAGLLTAPLTAAEVFSFLERGQEQGLFPKSTLTLASAQAVWTFFTNGDAPLAIVPATLFRSRQNEQREAGFAGLPTVDGQNRAVITTWNFALTTQDGERRQRALALLRALFAPHIQGEWSQEARQIPTQVEALDYWDRDDPFTGFVDGLLRGELTSPNVANAAPVARAIQQGQRAVLLGELSADAVVSGLPVGQ